MTHIQLEEQHAAMVHVLAKNPADIIASFNPSQVDLVHAALGVAGEAGELVDAIKKFAIYNKPLDMENVIEELGDLEFYLSMVRQRLMITREVTLRHNINKLGKRYPTGYSDKLAQDRLDKADEIERNPIAAAMDAALLEKPQGSAHNKSAEPLSRPKVDPLASTYHPPSCPYPHGLCNCPASR